MASIVTSTTFTATHTENIDINGLKQQSIRKLTKTKITDYSHRIMTLAANSTSTLLTLAASNAGGQVSSSDIEYVRISNLDDETSIRLVLNLVNDGNAAQGSFHIELPPLKSYLVSAKSACKVDAGGNFAAYNNISTIQAVTAAGNSIDIELFIASK